MYKFLCMRATCLLNRFSRARLSVAPWTVAHQAPLPMGFSRQEYWSGLPCPPAGHLPNPGVEPASPGAGRVFTTGAYTPVIHFLGI